MLVPKNTSVIVRRVPSVIPQKLSTLKCGVNDIAGKNFASLQQQAHANLEQAYIRSEQGYPDSISPGNSCAPLYDLNYSTQFLNSSESLDLHRVGYPSQSGLKSFLGVPPPSYTCHRCGQPGHFIQNCPTNGDPEYDAPRMKLPVGIPKSRLKVVPSGKSLQVHAATKFGGLLLPGGQIATLQANDDEFHKATMGIAKRVAVMEGTVPVELRCPVCRILFKDAVSLSCCSANACDNCVHDAINMHRGCPLCNESIRVDKVLPNLAIRKEVDLYLSKKVDSQISLQNFRHGNVMNTSEPSSHIAALDTSQLLARANMHPRSAIRHSMFPSSGIADDQEFVSPHSDHTHASRRNKNFSRHTFLLLQKHLEEIIEC